MKLSVFFIISIILLAFLLFISSRFNSCKRLSCLSIEGIENFKIKDVYQENNNMFRALYSNKNKILRVERVTQSDQFSANQYVNADVAQIKGLFTDALAPYPGIASNTISCSQEFQPYFDKVTTKNKLSITYFIAFLNSNLTYGSCNDSQAVNKGISAYFYCIKNKQAYHFEIISPRKEFETSKNEYMNLIQSIKCI